MLALNLTRPLRQVMATLAIVATSVVPTGYVALTAWRINRPGHLRDAEVELGRQLGLEVRLDGVRYPRPGEVIYRGAVLRQVEPSRKRELTEIARAEEVRLVRVDRQLILEADGLRLHGESPKLAMDQIGALLQRAGDGAWDRVTLSARTCEVELGNGGPASLRYAFRNVAGTFQADRGAPVANVSFGVPAGGSTTRCELVLTRDRKERDVRTSITFAMKEGLPLPARVLDPFLNTADWLGPGAKVGEGMLTLQKAGGADWRAEFQGDLIDVDLDTLVARRYPDHRLTGLARIHFKQAIWADRWIEADGELTTGPGTISVSLLRALESEMRFRLAKVDARKTDLAFHGLGFRFRMTPDSEIHLEGALGSEYPPGVVIVKANHVTPLAFAPTGAANVNGLIKALLPTTRSSVMIPNTPDAQILQENLPLPPPLASRTSAGN